VGGIVARMKHTGDRVSSIECAARTRGPEEREYRVWSIEYRERQNSKGAS
jgi:hypothetical protein